MKFIKNLLPFMGMGALLLTASCSSEDVPEQPVAGEGVTFTAPSCRAVPLSAAVSTQ